MIRQILTIVFVLFSFALFGQKTTVTDILRLAGKNLSQVDTTLQDTTHNGIPTTKAVKDYVDENGGGATNVSSPISGDGTPGNPLTIENGAINYGAKIQDNSPNILAGWDGSGNASEIDVNSPGSGLDLNNAVLSAKHVTGWFRVDTLLCIESTLAGVKDTLCVVANFGSDFDYNKILFVSPNGDNTDAQPNSLTNMYADPWAARDSSDVGDLIYIFPGEYDGSARADKSLGKCGIYYYCEPGTEITGYSTLFSDFGFISKDSIVRTGCYTKWFGHGKFSGQTQSGWLKNNWDSAYYSLQADEYIADKIGSLVILQDTFRNISMNFDIKNVILPADRINNSLVYIEESSTVDSSLFVLNFDNIQDNRDTNAVGYVHIYNSGSVIGTGGFRGSSLYFSANDIRQTKEGNFKTISGDRGIIFEETYNYNYNIENSLLDFQIGNFRQQYQTGDSLNYTTPFQLSSDDVATESLIRLGTYKIADSKINFHCDNCDTYSSVANISSVRTGSGNTQVNVTGNYRSRKMPLIISPNHFRFDTITGGDSTLLYVFSGTFISDSTEVVSISDTTRNKGTFMFEGLYQTNSSKNVITTRKELVLQNAVLRNDSSTDAIYSDRATDVRVAGVFQNSNNVNDNINIIREYELQGYDVATIPFADENGTLKTDTLLKKIGGTLLYGGDYWWNNYLDPLVGASSSRAGIKSTFVSGTTYLFGQMQPNRLGGYSYNSSSTGGSQVKFFRSRGTPIVPVKPNNNDLIASFIASSWDGANAREDYLGELLFYSEGQYANGRNRARAELTVSSRVSILQPQSSQIGLYINDVYPLLTRGVNSNNFIDLFSIDSTGTVRAYQYGAGNKEAADLGKTLSAYGAAYATDGTSLELPLTSFGTDDQTATEVPFTPTGNIASTNVQAAIAELDTEKAPLASPTFSGTVTGGAGGFVGNLSGTATNAGNVVVAETDFASTHYVCFTSGTSGNNAVQVDDQYTYNPSTNALTIAGHQVNVKTFDREAVRYDSTLAASTSYEGTYITIPTELSGWKIRKVRIMCFSPVLGGDLEFEIYQTPAIGSPVQTAIGELSLGTFAYTHTLSTPVTVATSDRIYIRTVGATDVSDFPEGLFVQYELTPN